MNSLEAVETLAVYLSKQQTLKVHKFAKTTSHKEPYIVVNALPFTYGRIVNDGIINVNLHSPKLHSGGSDNKFLAQALSSIENSIPYETDEEDGGMLQLNGSYFAITSVSQPIKDEDDTYFINIKVRIINF